MAKEEFDTFIDDFDSGSFDDFDSDGGGESTGRNTVAGRVYRKFSESVEAKKQDSDFKRKLLKSALPSSYGSVIDDADTISKEVGDVWREQERAWRDNRGKFKKALKPYSDIPKMIGLKKFAQWLEEEDRVRTSSPSDDELDELKIQSILTETFGNLQNENAKAQADSDRIKDEKEDIRHSEDMAEREVAAKRGIEGNQHLSNINRNTTILTDYNNKINFPYQKRSLELQARLLVTQQRALLALTSFRDSALNELSGITKNTSLPDYVKINSDEMIMKQIKEETIGKLVSPEGMLGRTGKRITNKVKSKMKDWWRYIGEGLDSIIMSNEDIGYDDDGNEISQVSKLGQLLSGMGMDKVVDLGAERLRKTLSPHARKLVDRLSGGKDYGTSVASILTNMKANMNESLKNDDFGNPILNSLSRIFELSSEAATGNTQLWDNNKLELEKAAFMDNRFKLSVTDVIPGWLKRIFGEVYGLNNKGGKAPDLVWDFNRRGFVDQKDIDKKVVSTVIDKKRFENLANVAEEWVKAHGGDYLGDDAKNWLVKWAVKEARAGNSLDAMKLFADNSGIPKKLRSPILDTIAVSMGLTAKQRQILTVGGRNSILSAAAINSEQARSLQRGLHDAGARLSSAANNLVDIEAINKLAADPNTRRALVNTGFVNESEDGSTGDFSYKQVDDIYHDGVSMKLEKEEGRSKNSYERMQITNKPYTASKAGVYYNVYRFPGDKKPALSKTGFKAGAYGYRGMGSNNIQPLKSPGDIVLGMDIFIRSTGTILIASENISSGLYRLKTNTKQIKLGRDLVASRMGSEDGEYYMDDDLNRNQQMRDNGYEQVVKFGKIDAGKYGDIVSNTFNQTDEDIERDRISKIVNNPIWKNRIGNHQEYGKSFILNRRGEIVLSSEKQFNTILSQFGKDDAGGKTYTGIDYYNQQAYIRTARGFASGGSPSANTIAEGMTSGENDKGSLARLHGSEYVVNSDATKLNKDLLQEINRLGAPLLNADKTINTVYHKLLGFKSSKEMDEWSAKTKGVKTKISDAADKQVEEMISKLITNLDVSTHSPSDMATVVDKSVPAKKRLTLALNMWRKQETELLKANPKQYGKRLGKMGINAIDGKINSLFDKDESGVARALKDTTIGATRSIAKGVGEVASDVKKRAGNAFDAYKHDGLLNRQATLVKVGMSVDKETSKLRDIYKAGESEPTFRRGVFKGTGYYDRETKDRIRNPSQITGGVVDAEGNVIATTEELFTTEWMVMNNNGKLTPFKFPGLSEANLTYMSKKEFGSKTIDLLKNSENFKATVEKYSKMKDTVMKYSRDDAIDIYTRADPLNPVLYKSYFNQGRYVDKETGNVLWTHHDITGDVVDVHDNASVILSKEAVEDGLFDSEGKIVKISKLKQYRNMAFRRGHEAYNKYLSKHVTSFRDKGLNMMSNLGEKRVGLNFDNNPIDVYRKGSDTPVITAGMFKSGKLLDVKTNKVLKSHSGISGPVIDTDNPLSSIINNQDIEEGLTNLMGEPLYLPLLKSAIGRFGEYLKKAVTPNISMLKMTASARKEKAIEDLKKAKIAFDVYLVGDLRNPVLYKTGFEEGKYVDQASAKVLFIPEMIAGTVVDLAGNVLLSEEDLKKGITNGRGDRINTEYRVNTADGIVAKTLARVRMASSIVNRTKSKMSTFKNDEISGGIKDVFTIQIPSDKTIVKYCKDLYPEEEANSRAAAAITNFQRIRKHFTGDSLTFNNLDVARGHIYLHDSSEGTFTATKKIKPLPYYSVIFPKGVTPNIDNPFFKVSDLYLFGGQIINIKGIPLELGKEPTPVKATMVSRMSKSGGFLSKLKKGFSLSKKRQEDIIDIDTSNSYTVMFDMSGGQPLPSRLVRFNNRVFTTEDIAAGKLYDLTIVDGEPVIKPLSDVREINSSSRLSDFTSDKHADALSFLEVFTNGGAIIDKNGDVVKTAYHGWKPKGPSVASRIKSGITSVKSKLKGAASRTVSRIGNLKDSISESVTNRLGSWKRQREDKAKQKELEANKKTDDKTKEKKPSFISKLVKKLMLPLGGMFTNLVTRVGGMFAGLGGIFGGAMSWLGQIVGKGKLLGGLGSFLGRAGLGKALGVAALTYGGIKAFDFMDNSRDGPVGYTELEKNQGYSKLDSTSKMMNAGQMLNEQAQEQGEEKAGLLDSPAAKAIMAGLGYAALSSPLKTAKLVGKLGLGATKLAGKGIMLGGKMAGKITGKVGKSLIKRVPGAAKAALNVGRLGGGLMGTAGKIGLNLLRFAGPIGLAVTAATAVYYGAKFGMKLWNNAKNPWNRFRMAQYGFDHNDKKIMEKIAGLEDVARPLLNVTKDGKARIKTDEAVTKNILRLMEFAGEDGELKPEFSEGGDNIARFEGFLGWFQGRFIPVYASYLVGLLKLTGKAEMVDLSKLNRQEQLALLDDVHYKRPEGSPYMVKFSPFEKPAEIKLDATDIDKIFRKVREKIKNDDKIKDGVIKDHTTQIEPAPKNADGVDDKQKPLKKDATPEEKLNHEINKDLDRIKEEKKSPKSVVEEANKAVKYQQDQSRLMLTAHNAKVKAMTEEATKATEETFEEKSVSLMGKFKGWMSDLSNRFTSGMDKIRGGEYWEGIKDIGGAAHSAMTFGVSDKVGNAVSNAWSGTKNLWAEMTGSAGEIQRMVFNAFVRAGLTPNQAKAITAEVGRENDFKASTIFGSHVDPAKDKNGKNIINTGMLSWNRQRGEKLRELLRSRGQLDSSNNMPKTQEALDTQAEFAVNEMRSKSYASRLQNFWSNPEADPESFARELGKYYVVWAYGRNDIAAGGGRRIPFNWKQHDDKRRKYLNMMGDVTVKGQETASAGGASQAITETVGGGEGGNIGSGASTGIDLGGTSSPSTSPPPLIAKPDPNNPTAALGINNPANTMTNKVNQHVKEAARPKYFFGDSIAEAYMKAHNGLGKCVPGSKPKNVVDMISHHYLYERSKVAKDAIYFISTGIINDPADRERISYMMELIKKMGVSANIFGVSETYPSKNGQLDGNQMNVYVKVLAEKFGHKFLGAYKPNKNNHLPSDTKNLTGNGSMKVATKEQLAQHNAKQPGNSSKITNINTPNTATKVPQGTTDNTNTGKQQAQTEAKQMADTGTDWDLSKMAEAITRGKSGKSLGRCAEYTRKAMQKGDLKGQITKKFGGALGHAFQWKDKLPQIGYNMVFEGKHLGPFQPRIGDIAYFDRKVYGANDKSGGGWVYGHVCMYNGTVWISDFQQATVYPSSVYAAKGIPFMIFRANGIAPKGGFSSSGYGDDSYNNPQPKTASGQETVINDKITNISGGGGYNVGIPTSGGDDYQSNVNPEIRQQGVGSISMTDTNNILNSQLDIQKQMLDVLKSISSAIGGGTVTSGVVNPTLPRNTGVEQAQVTNQTQQSTPVQNEPGSSSTGLKPPVSVLKPV